MKYLGKVEPGSTIYIPFNSTDASGASISIDGTSFVVSDIRVYKNGSTIQRSSTNGFTIVGEDFDSVTGVHLISIDLSDNTDAAFYSAGAHYTIVLSSITVDGQTVNVALASFKIGYVGSRLDTTVATLSSQTSFTLTAGPAEDDALNGLELIIHDVASAVQVGRAVVLDYTGSTRTVTLAAATTFTVATTDNVSVMGLSPLTPTVTGRQINVTSSGEIGAIGDSAIVSASFAAATGLRPVRSGTAQAGASDSITLDAGASSTFDFYNKMRIYIVSGTGAGLYSIITTYDGTTKIAGVHPNWVTTPDNTSVFAILPDGVVDVHIFNGSATSADGLAQMGSAYGSDGRVDANVETWNSQFVSTSSDTNLPNVAIQALYSQSNNVELQILESVDGNITFGDIATILADTNDIQSRLPAALVSGRMDVSVGAMQNNVVTAAAIADGAIDTNTFAAGAITAAAIADGAIDAATFAAGAITAAAIATGAIDADALATDAVGEIADGIWDEAISGHLTAGSTGNALNAAGSAGDPWSTPLPGAYGAGTAGFIIGTNIDALISSRASQTSVNTIDDFIDTEIATLVSNVATILTAVDTEVAAIKTKTDQLTFTIANRLDCQVYGMENGTITSAVIATGAIDADALSTDAIDEIWDEIMEGTVTARQSLRLANSANGADTSGGGTAQFTLRDIADTKNRVVATVDADGNRSITSMDLT